MHAVIEVVTEIAAVPAVVFDLELDMDEHTASLAGSGERARTRADGAACSSVTR